jgi:hypothetical protein
MSTLSLTAYGCVCVRTVRQGHSPAAACTVGEANDADGMVGHECSAQVFDQLMLLVRGRQKGP